MILRVKRIGECIAFYDRVMPFLGLKAVPPRTDFFVYDLIAGSASQSSNRISPDRLSAT